VKEKPDLMDGILFYERMAQEKGYPNVIYDFPELSVELVKAFFDIWCLPEGAFPRKREVTKYINWCSQLEELNRLFSSDARMRLAMKRAFDNYLKMENKPIVFEPRNIKPIVINAIGELRREEKNKPKQVSQTMASPENIKKAVKDLKNIFHEDEE